MTGQAERAYDLFVSYASGDEAWVKGYLFDALERAGIAYLWEEAFALGVPRLIEFERAIQASKRTLLVLSPAYLADESAQFTDLLTQTYGMETATWPVIPLILHPVKLPPRLAMLTALPVTEPEDWEEAIARLLADLQRPTAIEAIPKPPCPYPGMLPFSEAEHDRFFGRDQEVREAVERLRLHPFLTVIGPSGSGKSSLVYAGLVPTLRQSGLFGPDASPLDGSPWLVHTLRPGELPMEALTAALQGDPRQPEQAVSGLLAAHPGAQRALLIVDQFEETFTLATQDTEAFQRAVLALSAASNCYVILTVRADFYPDLMACPLWDAIQRHRLEVQPLGEEGLRQAIARPAEGAGVFVETALVERLLADAAGEPGVLPLVQETLVLLWERLERRYLPLRAYEALVMPKSAYGQEDTGQGERTGLQVAMARRAEAALDALTAKEQEIAQRILTRLVQPGEGRADTRRQQKAAQLRAAGDDKTLFNRTLSHLAERRLLTLSGEEREGRKVDIAHEALIAGWPRLQRWVNEDREGLLIQRQIGEAARDWERGQRDASYLYRGKRLSAAEQWRRTHADASNLLEEAFLQHSRQRARRQTFAWGGGMAIVVIAILVAMIAQAGPFAPRIHWTQVPAFASEVSQVTWGREGTMYAGLGEGAASSSAARSADGGATWTHLDLRGAFVWNLLADPYREGFVYASLGKDGLFYTADGGEEWTAIGSDLPLSEIDALAVSPAGTLYAGDFTATVGVYTSADRGASWSPLSGSPQAAVYALHWADDRLLVGTDRGLWQWTADGNWEALIEGSTPVYAVTSVKEVIFAGQEDGIWRLNGSERQQIAKEEVTSISTSTGEAPLLVAGTLDGQLLLWELDGQGTARIARSSTLGGASYIYTAHVRRENGIQTFWAGAENGLWRGEMRHWYDWLWPF